MYTYTYVYTHVHIHTHRVVLVIKKLLAYVAVLLQ